MTTDGAGRGDLRVLIVAPTRRDVEITRQVLASVAIVAEPTTVAELPDEIGKGVGAVLLTEVALADPAFGAVLRRLEAEPPWSDTPFVLLMRDRESRDAARVIGALKNVSILDRPVSLRTVTSALQTALRARTRQYEMRDQLVLQQRVESELIVANRRKDEFLATLSHELRNPLAPIRSGLDILERMGSSEPRAVRVVEIMGKQVDLMIRLIDDLLDVARISGGKVKLDHELVDLRTAVLLALEGGRPAAEARRQDLDSRIPSSPVWVMGDAVRLAQVAGNLLNNAIKYTPDGGRIEVLLGVADDWAVLQVADNGAGLPAEMLAKVFEMFAQVDRTLDRAQGGLGIGLSLVRSMVERHGGSVSVESDGPDKGSVFTVRLPIAQAPGGSTTGQPGEAPVASTGGATSVLVVDDNADAAEALAMLMEMRGDTVSIAHSGPEALQLLRSCSYDLMICDIGIPGMDGLEIARRVRAQPAHDDMFLVALSGWGSDEDKRRTDAAGFQWHLTKPVDEDMLRSVLDDASRRKPRP